MSKEEMLMNIQSKVPKEIHKKLNHLSVDMDMTLPEVIREILEKALRNKKFEKVEVNISEY